MNLPMKIQTPPIYRVLKSADLKRLIVIGMLLSWCTCMVAVRIGRTGTLSYRFLLDNLFLACVPLFLSTLLRIGNRLRMPWTILIGPFVLWLLFLPNAPYLLTDIMHLSRAWDVPLWYDLALLLSCAGTGLLLGYLSLEDVQGIVARRYGSVIGWTFAIVSLVLSGFAIYLGRFLRWNSWDVLVAPSLVLRIAGGLLDPMSHLRPLAVTIVFGIIFVLGYISMRILLFSESKSG